MRRLAIGLGVVSLVVIAACGGGLGPAVPTRKAVSTWDVLGTWTFDTSSGGHAVTLTFEPDGSFQQTVTDRATGRETKQPGGHWSLRDNHITLDDYVSAEWKVPYAMSWYFIGGENSSPLVLYGGDHPDPDSFVAMSKVSKAR